ncbi:MAG: hypothetical protein K0S01_608 [Herbinix sp.]|nr:hypothetical protein [Herbinix sp.]
MDRIVQTIEDNKAKKILRWCIASILVLIITSIILTPKLTNAAENSISIKEINYKNSTITLLVNAGDTEVYFSDSAKKKWEVIPGKIKSDRTITMDISWISTTSNYVLNLKGNLSTDIISVILPKQITNFKASYNKVKGTVTFSDIGDRTIEWRKKDSTTWSIVDTNTLTTELSYLYTNGASIYFRLAPVNGVSGSDTGARASKEVMISIPKKLSAPSISINGSAFSIPVKKGMSYRQVNSNGSTSDWIIINSTTNLLLKDIAASSLYTSDTATRQKVTLQFRTNATTSSQVSNITTVTIPIQEGKPNVDTYGISLAYTSSSTLSLQVKAASSTVPFEYTIIKEESELNYQTAKWTTISSSALLSINSTVAPNGSHIYVRKKSIEATDTVEFALASVETDIAGSNGVNYPNAPIVNAVKTLITTAGVCRTGNSAGILSFALYSPTSTTVASINFVDAYGIVKGNVTCNSSVAVNSASTGASDKYIITTNITSTSNLDTITEELLYANITLANSDTINSSATKGIILYLYPNTVVNNPNESDYSANFKRVYLSKEDEDASNFKFQLDFGTQKVIDTSAINRYTTTDMAISSIKLSKYTLLQGTDYTIEYGTYKDSSNKTIATATVTVNLSNFENSSAITDMDLALPLIVNLNNNEILDNDIYVTLKSTAKLDNAPIAWSITEGSLKETKSTTKTNTDGSTTVITEEVITYTITLSLFDSAYGVSVSDVTWGGTSIFGSATVAAGKATISLSNAKINKLTTNSTDTQNIIIKLSNGFSINTGCKLTIMNATQ